MVDRTEEETEAEKVLLKEATIVEQVMYEMKPEDMEEMVIEDIPEKIMLEEIEILILRLKSLKNLKIK